MDMKKKIGIAACCFAACLIGGAVALTKNTTITADASTKETLVFTENFNDKEFSALWSEKDASLHADYDAMRFNGGYYWQGAVVLNAYEKADYNKFVFDMQLAEYEMDSWIAFAFGGEEVSSSFFEYDGFLDMKNTNVSLVYSVENFEHTRLYSAQELFSKMKAGKTQVEIVFDKDEKGTYTCELGYSFADGTSYGFAWEEVEINENKKYFAFNSANVVWDLIDFKVLDKEGNERFHDDFTSPTLTYEADKAENGNWHVAKAYTQEEIYVGKIGALEISKAGGIIYHEPLMNTAETDTVHRFTYQLRVDELAEKDVIGFGFGLKTQESALDETAFVGVTKTSETAAALVLVKNGEIKKTAMRFPLEALALGEGKFLPVEIRLTYNYGIEVEFAGQIATFASINYEGYFGVGGVALDGEMDSVALVDDLSMFSRNALSHSSKDASNSFAGTKTTEEGTSYYLDKNKWFIGPKVKLKGYFAWDEAGDQAILFSNSNAYSCFGYRARYDEFIVRFDVTMKSLGSNGQAFGLSFNKSSFFTNIEKSTSVGFMYNGYDETNIRSMIRGYNCLSESGAAEIEMPDETHFWKDTETRYNFMFIVKDRSVEVYYKEDGADISQLGICRAKFVDVDTDGYVAVFGSGSASFALHDYSIVNIGEGASWDSEAPTREHFEDGTLAGTLLASGETSGEKGIMTLKNGASLQETAAGNYYLAQLKVTDAEGAWKVGFSTSNEVLFDGEQNRIGFIENGKTTYVNLPSDRKLINQNGATMVALNIIGNTVKVGVRGESEAADCIYKTVASYEYESAFAKGNFTITSGTLLSLDEVKIYHLDCDYTAQKTDYDPADDEVTPWVEKEELMDGQEEKPDVPTQSSEPEQSGDEGSGCASQGSVLCVLSCLALALVCRKKRGERA